MGLKMGWSFGSFASTPEPRKALIWTVRAKHSRTKCGTRDFRRAQLKRFEPMSHRKPKFGLAVAVSCSFAENPASRVFVSFAVLLIVLFVWRFVSRLWVVPHESASAPDEAIPFRGIARCDLPDISAFCQARECGPLIPQSVLWSTCRHTLAFCSCPSSRPR